MIFLKLGGSLITDKMRPETIRPEVLKRIASEIAAFTHKNPGEKLLLGHGSGSFGHYHAARYQTHLGANTPEEWRGFSEVWAAANRLNNHVLNSLLDEGLPVICFAPCSSAIARSGRIESMEVEPIRRCLDAGLIPLVHGDTAFDRALGSTIISTEEIFRRLLKSLQPDTILLAGVDEGVLRSCDDSSSLINELTPAGVDSIHLGKSMAPDVTGGMLDKVMTAFEFLEIVPGLEVHIFSGLQPGSVMDALCGKPSGTRLHSG